MLSIRGCDYCGLSVKPSSCSKCKSVYYCCKDHQISSWKSHRNHCVKTISSKFRNISDVINHSQLILNPIDHISDHSKYLNDNRFVDMENRKVLGDSTMKMISSNENINSVNGLEVKNKICTNNTSNDKSLINNSNRIENEPSFKSQHDTLTLSNKEVEESYDLIAEFCKEILNKGNKKNDDFLLDEICQNVVKDMDRYGVSVVDNFLGLEKGTDVLNEVLHLSSEGVFQDGQLLNYKKDRDSKTIRSDRIAWIDGKRTDCTCIDSLIKRVDRIVMKCNRMSDNGEMGRFKIDGRTKAMVACYPSGGSHYVKHVDNPNQDGRRITAIYYLNQNWISSRDGGLLRIFPSGWKECVADIDPLFDRLLFFWSDRRNPHEVQPAFRTRYAITLWYFDAEERKRATLRDKPLRPTVKRLNTNNFVQQNIFV